MACATSMVYHPSRVGRGSGRSGGLERNSVGAVRKRDDMADLIAIAYPDEATAEAAADEARRLAADLIIQPDAIAVITRDKEGTYHVTTSHHPMTKGASWGLFWGFLFGLLFFIPVFGMAVGAGLGALMGKFAKTSI